MKRLHPATRILLVFALVAMSLAWSRPAWQIRLWAPQYPEGLAMQIWLDDITGDVDVVNGLNHYIGMKKIKVENFPEFRFMKRILLGIIAIGVLAVLAGRRPFLWVYVLSLFAAAAAGLGDFRYWSREFGHNLDPSAAISIPGMSYDPPLIGYKAILNFVAYSAPDIGGWLLIGSGVLASVLLAWEIWRTRGNKAADNGRSSVVLAAIAFAPLFLILPSCERGPRAIDYGKEDCAGCNMTLMDKRYGTQYITPKGKVFIFDDLNCMVEFIHRDPSSREDKVLFYVIDFNRSGEFIDATRAVYLQHKKLRSPMRADIAAFPDETKARAALAALGDEGAILRWDELKEKFKP